jgi:hypothetical protein
MRSHQASEAPRRICACCSVPMELSPQRFRLSHKPMGSRDLLPIPRHLAGRLFSIVVHGDAEGALGLRRALSDWLVSMRLRPAGNAAELDRYVGYWKPYATSHDELDADTAIQEEVRIVAQTLIAAIAAQRSGQLADAKPAIAPPRQK